MPAHEFVGHGGKSAGERDKMMRVAVPAKMAHDLSEVAEHNIVVVRLCVQETLVLIDANAGLDSGNQMVADYFYLLDKKLLEKPIKLTPVVQSLRGSLKDADIDENGYKSYLEDKYL